MIAASGEAGGRYLMPCPSKTVKQEAREISGK